MVLGLESRAWGLGVSGLKSQISGFNFHSHLGFSVSGLGFEVLGGSWVLGLGSPVSGVQC